MSATAIDQIVSTFATLPPAEQRQVVDQLSSLVAKPPSSLEDSVEQQLVARGVIDFIPPPITDLLPYKNRSLVQVLGKPLSETVIEERR